MGATVRRSRPIVLTAAAAVLALVPLAFSVFWGPMAIAIMGGLLSATLLTLCFVPALYAAVARVKRVARHTNGVRQQVPPAGLGDVPDDVPHGSPPHRIPVAATSESSVLLRWWSARAEQSEPRKGAR